MNLILAWFLVILGLSIVGVALFLALGYLGLLLLGGAMITGAGLLVIPVDRRDR